MWAIGYRLPYPEFEREIRFVEALLHSHSPEEEEAAAAAAPRSSSSAVATPPPPPPSTSPPTSSTFQPSSQPSMELNPKLARKGIPDEALKLIFSFIDDPQDRNSISLVCKQWHRLDNLTRKEVTVAFCYASTPSSLTSRFNSLQAVKLKGKPRAAKFGTLIPKDWGGCAKHWVREIARFCSLKAVHLRRMVVSDEDLLTLAKERGQFLHVLKLDTCSGFSTTGLEAITRCCRYLSELTLEESNIDETNGKWLHELALQNSSSLEVLNFSGTNFEKVDVADLDTLARNCRSLSSLKLDYVGLNKLSGLLSRATALKELGGVVVPGDVDDNNGLASEEISLPKSLTSLVRLTYMDGGNGDACVISLIQPLASGLRRLDLQYAALSVQGHCQLLQHCSNLEVLEVMNDIGDEGLEVVAKSCKNLQRLWVEMGEREVQQGYVTQRGLISIAQGCQNLEHIAMYISGISNAALVAMGENCPKLKDFRLCLLTDDSDSPLDNGVRALLRGCCDLTRLALYLRPDFLTDKGMSYIGKFGLKLRWALLGEVGETDAGFSLLADGCPKLEKLEMRGCKFTEAGISRAVMKMNSLKYIWVQGATIQGQALHAMKRPFWNIEFIPEQRHTGVKEGDLVPCGNHEYEHVGYHDKEPAQFLAYRSLAGKRTDCPERFLCFP